MSSEHLLQLLCPKPKLFAFSFARIWKFSAVRFIQKRLGLICIIYASRKAAAIGKLFVFDLKNDLNQRVVAVESSLEFLCAKLSSMEAEVSDLKNKLSESHRQVEKYRIQDEFRSKEYNLLFHGIEITKMPETPNLSDQLVRSFMTEKLQFAPSLVSNMKFANVHRLPRRTDASKISNSTSKRPPPIVVISAI